MSPVPTDVFTAADWLPEKDFAGGQWCGKRATQQDAYAFADIGPRQSAREGLLLVVADGMGGHQGGECASNTALQGFIQEYQNCQGTGTPQFQRGLEAANAAIAAEVQQSNGSLAGMGTTLLAVSVQAWGLEWLSVGDCALYLLRGEEFTRLNDDHSCRSLIMEKYQRGEITAEQAATHPDRTKLRSALMGGRVALVHTAPEPVALKPGDLVLAATDGLETLSRAEVIEILKTVSHGSAMEMVECLLRAVQAVGHPGQDNTTVALVKIPESRPAASVPSRPRVVHEVRTRRVRDRSTS